MAQEELIKASGIPYTILRSTQFFEFVNGIIKSGTEGDVIRLSPALIQPIASDDVAAALAEVTLTRPLNGTVQVAGPEARPLDSFACKFLAASGDAREETGRAYCGERECKTVYISGDALALRKKQRLKNTRHQI